MRLGILSIFVLILMCDCVSPSKLARVDNQPLAPGDCVVITLDLMDAELQDRMKFYLLDSSGDVSLVYVSKIHLAGLTPEQAERRIHDVYVPKYFTYMGVTVRRCH